MATPDIKEIKTIVDWVNATADVRELSLKVGDVELHISKNREPQGAAAPAPAESVGVAPAAAAPVAAPTAAAPAAAAPKTESAKTAASPETTSAAPAGNAAPGSPATPALDVRDGDVVIKAPMVGVFYASPQPGAPAFVQLGDSVSADSVLGIVEVMKLMNNIEATVAGEVVQILVANEQAVEYGQPLAVIRPASGAGAGDARAAGGAHA